jgi:uncharacterized protein YggE
MKRIPTLLNAILAALLLVFVLPVGLHGVSARAPAPASTLQPQTACGSSRTVQVTGSATINVIPDRALIQLGVQSNGATPTAAQFANSAAIQSVLKALQVRGVAAKDIATDVYVVEPVYEDYDSLYIKGYRINNVVAVTLRDVKMTGPVLVAALEAGANQVVDVEFYTSELRTYRDQARELAMKAAREKAQALATAASAQAGCVLSITENTWSYYNGWWHGGSPNSWAQNVVQNAAASPGSRGAAGDEPISLGQVSVRAEVAVTFGLG